MLHDLFQSLPDHVPDGLLAVLLACRDDPRAHKVDLGMGVFRDDTGATPVMAAVKAAEARLLDGQVTKTYLGADGDRRFVDLVAALALGADRAADPALVGVQTPGGSGALCIAAELAARLRPSGTVWMSDPTWANHVAVFSAAGLRIARYPFQDRMAQRFDAEGMFAALEAARPGDAVLLQASCHNPTGIELEEPQWQAMAELVARRGLLPIIDLAYQGLGHGLDADAAPARLLFDRAEAAILTYSCDKNFGLYRERTGALFVGAPSETQVSRLRAALRDPIRATWAMPPDHGAAVVRTILDDADLSMIWRSELEANRLRIAGLRADLAAAHPALAAVTGQTGLFAMLPLRPDAIVRLREDDAIYLLDDGRINVAGLTPYAIERIAAALG